MIENNNRKSYTLGGLTVQAGEKKNGFIKLADDITLPVTILHGETEGKTVLITAGVHAAEYVGIQASMELADSLYAESVAGTIIILKVMNRPAFEHRAGSLGFTDQKNLNRVFPGKADGTEMERLAYIIVQELFSRIDYYIDLHSGDDFEELTPYVYYAGKASEEVSMASRKMAEQIDVPYMVKSNTATGGAYNYAASIGIPSILIERGSMGAWNSEESGSTSRDVRNVLCSIGVYRAMKDYRSYYPLDVEDVIYQDASHTGLWYRRKNAGEVFRQGEILGEVRDYSGNVLEVCVAEYDGVILYQTASLQVIANGPMIAYGRIVRKQDDRKERIVHYWSRRSESFLDQRRNELHSTMADRWLAEIDKYIPKNKSLRILDVGCGAGFFSILLAKRGHEVIGIDLTPEMIQNARILASEEQVPCDFFIMDAENPAFSDESFDFVITRNLTWTLPHVEHAYEQWLRVLKKDGVLLNFDANYGADDTTDTSNLPPTHAHIMIGKEMNIENEAIKRQLPISSYVRPAWDVDTLGKLGAQRISIDRGISPRIYLKVDELYNPVPMFAIAVWKE